MYCIGRIGRAGKSGVAITFLSNEDADVMYDVKQMLMKSQISRVPDELRKHEAAQSKPNRSAAASRKGNGPTNNGVTAQEDGGGAPGAGAAGAGSNIGRWA